MLRKVPEIKQRDMFYLMLKDFIGPYHELALLIHAID